MWQHWVSSQDPTCQMITCVPSAGRPGKKVLHVRERRERRRNWVLFFTHVWYNPLWPSEPQGEHTHAHIQCKYWMKCLCGDWTLRRACLFYDSVQPESIGGDTSTETTAAGTGELFPSVLHNQKSQTPEALRPFVSAASFSSVYWLYSQFDP